MLWMCMVKEGDVVCGCCKSESGAGAPSVPCANFHANGWQRIDDAKQCKCWVGIPLPGDA